MLADPTFSYKKIGDEFGVTRQDISFLGKKLGVDARQRQHDRVRPRIIRNFEKYPATIQAVIDKLRRAGLRVDPYNAPQPSARNVSKTQERLEPVRERMGLAGLTNDRDIIDSIPVETCRIATWYETNFKKVRRAIGG